jgi:hypothetical protein
MRREHGHGSVRLRRDRQGVYEGRYMSRDGRQRSVYGRSHEEVDAKLAEAMHLDKMQDMARSSHAPGSRTALYRYFDKDDSLLYVGISVSPIARQLQHRQTSRWYDRVAKMTVEWCESREEALDLERIAIINERPRHNIRHKATSDVSPFPKVRPASLKCRWPKAIFDDLSEDAREMLVSIYEFVDVRDAYATDWVEVPIQAALTAIGLYGSNGDVDIPWLLSGIFGELRAAGPSASECRGCRHWMAGLIGSSRIKSSDAKVTLTFTPSPLMTDLIAKFPSYHAFAQEYFS